MADWTKPQAVDRLTMAFGCGKDFEKLLPPMQEIPEEFTCWNPNGKWQRLMNDWFFTGLAAENLVPKPGIDKKQAMAHLRALIGSFEPKHEHKEAAVSWLASLWFEDSSTWTPRKRGVAAARGEAQTQHG